MASQSTQKFDAAYVGWKAFGGLLCSLLFVVLGWHVNTSLTRVYELEVAVRRIELSLTEVRANRFTASDGQQVLNRILEVQQYVAKIPLESPPEWFLKKVEKLEAEVEDLCEEQRQRCRSTTNQ
jgi:hypothetical protein